MAERKPAIETLAPIDTGFDGSDMGIPVLSIVHTSSKAFKSGLAKFGDLVIGMNAEDPETQVVYSNKAGDPPLVVHMIGRVDKWYAMKYGKGDGRWDIDGTPRPLFDGSMSPPMPPDAELNYRYTLLIPSYSKAMPVHFYVKGTAERAMKGMVNKIQFSADDGIHPHELAFGIATTHRSAGTNEWYVPDVSLVEPDPQHVAIGTRLANELTKLPQRQLVASSDTVDSSSKPGF